MSEFTSKKRTDFSDKRRKIKHKKPKASEENKELGVDIESFRKKNRLKPTIEKDSFLELS